jgi:hypothetical protein
MSTVKRATVWHRTEIHLVAAQGGGVDKSISDMVNDAVKLTLTEDAEDLEAIESRKREPNLDFERFVKALKRRGKL